MIRYHNKGNIKVAEIMPGSEIISNPDDILGIMVEAGYNDCAGIIIHQGSLHPDFFDLRTGLAGEILQKFSNYRMQLRIAGDFSDVGSRSLRDFISESNKRGVIRFVNSTGEALSSFREKA